MDDIQVPPHINMRAATLNNATEYQNLFKHKCPTFIQRTPKLAPSREASGTAEPCHAARLHIEADARKLARYEAHHVSFTYRQMSPKRPVGDSMVSVQQRVPRNPFGGDHIRAKIASFGAPMSAPMTR